MTFKVGIIGGSGLENPQILHNAREIAVETPFGKPSDVLVEGEIGGVPCVLLSRHGRRHEINPTNVNYRANLWALMKQGVTVIIASTACGSLVEEYEPGHIVFPDSIIDRTTKRESSFHDGKEGHPPGVCHIQMHPTFNEKLRQEFIASAVELHLTYHATGTAVAIEGPRFSTRAESFTYKSWNAHLVNMTIAPEAFLAKELGIPYASAALVTDYDCWRATTESVSVEKVMATFAANVEKAKQLFIHTVARVAKIDWSEEVRGAKKTARESVMLTADVVIEHLKY